jgi:PAS domain S-box-containing protein
VADNGAPERDEQRAAAEFEDSAEDLYEHAPCGYLSCYPDGQIARVNQTFLSWTGYTRAELVGGRRFVDLLTAGGRIYHETHYAPLLRMQGSVRAIAVDLMRADGTRMPVLINSDLRMDEAGRPLAVRTTVFDATERKQYETELLAARRRAESAYDEQRTVATTLQRSMMAQTLPDDPRLRISACYRPAIDGLDVGGDWYDAFVLDDDRVALVVGDVVGRGLHAAAAMGQLRSAVRALAMADSGPAELLERLDRFVEGVEAANTATVAYAEVDLRKGNVVFACAGHPPPVLVDGSGRSALLWDGRSAPLGAQFGVGPRPAASITLTPGARLVLYTDGLVERRDQPLDLSIDVLAQELEGWAERPFPGLADGVADALLGTGRTSDDVCVLAVAFGEHPAVW